MKEYTIYGEESGKIKTFKTLKEAKQFIKIDLKRFDEKQSIEDIYYIIKSDVLRKGERRKNTNDNILYRI